jgi:hypothetical protein
MARSYDEDELQEMMQALEGLPPIVLSVGDTEIDIHKLIRGYLLDIEVSRMSIAAVTTNAGGDHDRHSNAHRT